MKPSPRRASLALLTLLACGCATPYRAVALAPAPTAVGAPGTPALGEAQWKERMALRYVFLERRGDYRRLDAVGLRLMQLCDAAGVVADGPPFALFFDDPAHLPTEELRARVCLPVLDPPADLPVELSVAVLPRAMVVYASVGRAAGYAAHAFPALFAAMHELGGTRAGPIREVYAQEGTEVQIPWTVGG